MCQELHIFFHGQISFLRRFGHVNSKITALLHTFYHFIKTYEIFRHSERKCGGLCPANIHDIFLHSFFPEHIGFLNWTLRFGEEFGAGVSELRHPPYTER